MTNKFPKESFNLREAKGEGFYKIMMVNESLKEYKFKNEFPWLLHFDIEMKEIIHPLRLPTNEESAILNSLEDKITSIIQSTVPYQFIGRITDNGHRVLYFYIESPKEMHEKLQALIKPKDYEREFDYSIREDSDWKSVDFFFEY